MTRPFASRALRIALGLWSTLGWACGSVANDPNPDRFDTDEGQPDGGVRPGRPDADPDPTPDAMPSYLQCPPPGASDCSPGSGSGTDIGPWNDAPSCFYGQVRSAVTGVVADFPELFEYNSELSCNGVRPGSEDVYVDAVAFRVAGGGLCAQQDPNAGDNITVKLNNTYAENFDILASTGCVRFGDRIYTGRNVPAWW